MQHDKHQLLGTLGRILCHLMFWLWNGSVLLTAYVGILPYIGVPLVADTIAGLIPFDFFLTLVALIVIPTVGAILGVWKLRKLPVELLRLLYGIETPLFLLGVLRLFLIRELTTATTFMLGTFVIAIAAFAYEVFYSHERRYPPTQWIQLATHTIMFGAGLHIETLLLFYVIPAAVAFLEGFFSFQWFPDIFHVFVSPMALIFLSFGLLSTLVFLTMPVAFGVFYTYYGYRHWQRFAGQYGKRLTAIGVAATMLAWFFLSALTQSQPHIKAFGLLSNPPQNENARRELLSQKEAIRKGLLNAYLYPYRYLSTREENTHIREMYHEVFDVDRETVQPLQDLYNMLVAPFLYTGFSNDDGKAAKLYGEFFDTPIQKGETNAIRHALQSTFNRDEAKAGLLNINQEKVWLAEQRVTLTPQGDWAQVELYEVYENQTAEEQEVFYSFSLPESAVFTGLWLGNSPKLEDRFVFQVAARGAAQQVYNEQVRVRRDPALLEQVGPRHYRLRAFPVLARPRDWRRGGWNSKQDRPRLYLWLTYAVVRQDNSWPLPHLGEKRNVFWTKNTMCTYNGYKTKHTGNDWLPASLEANQPGQSETRELTLANGYRITAKPLAANDYVLPQGKRFAVLLDTSYSLSRHVKAIQATTAYLQETLARQNHIDLYLSDSQSDRAKRLDNLAGLDPKKLIFFGTVQFKDILRQFDRLRGDTAYDAILLVTDEGSYELADNDKTLPTMPAPLWMVHVGGLPKAYDDTTLQAIQQRRGGVATSIQEVVQRLATTATLGESVISVTDGYAWFLSAPEQPTDVQTTTPATDGFTAIAARQAILGLSQKLDMTTLSNLDLVHRLAQAYQIVSPYSSMIVLVNEAQREALKKAEAQADRFEREVETGHENLQKPFNPMKTAAEATVPEPETILLVAVAVVVLAVLAMKKRGTTQH